MSGCSSTFVKDYLCFILFPLLLCQRLTDYSYAGLFLESLFCHWNICIFLVYSFIKTILSWLLQLCTKFWHQGLSVLFLLIEYCVCYSGSFASPLKIQNQFFNTCKITCWIIKRNHANSVMHISSAVVPVLLDILFCFSKSFFFFCLHLSFVGFYWNNLKLRDSVLSHVHQRHLMIIK